MYLLCIPCCLSMFHICYLILEIRWVGSWPVFSMLWMKSDVRQCSMMAWLYLVSLCMVNPLRSLSLGGEVEIWRGEEPIRKVNLFKKRAPNKDVPSAPKANFERGGGSQFDRHSCSNCGKKHFVKYLVGTSGCKLS